MPATKLSDLEIPSNWAPHVQERTAQKSALWQSGLVVSDERLDALVAGGGQKFTMPAFKDLTGNSEVLSDVTPLTVSKIEDFTELAIAFGRGKAWGASQLGAAFSGTSPLNAIAELVSDWWARDMQTTLIAALNGFFASTSMATTHVVDQSANTITSNILIDTMLKLGDASNKLEVWGLNSFVYGQLLKQNLITFRKLSEQGEEMPTYLGKDVIVDDEIPITPTTVTSYLFGRGAIGFGEAEPNKQPVETDRDSLLGEDYLIMRRKFALHPLGGSYTGTYAGSSPTNAELAIGTNWNRVYDVKNVRMIKLITKV